MCFAGLFYIPLLTGAAKRGAVGAINMLLLWSKGNDMSFLRSRLDHCLYVLKPHVVRDKIAL